MSVDSDTSPYRDLQQLTTATFFPYDSQHHKRLLLHEMKFNLLIELFFFSQSYSRVSEMVSCEGKNWKSRTNPLQGCQIQQETNTSRTATGLWETATGRLAGLVQDARYDSQNTHILVLLVNALCFFFNQYLALTSDYSLRGEWDAPIALDKHTSAADLFMTAKLLPMSLLFILHCHIFWLRLLL